MKAIILQGDAATGKTTWRNEQNKDTYILIETCVFSTVRHKALLAFLYEKDIIVDIVGITEEDVDIIKCILEDAKFHVEIKKFEV